VLTTYAGLLLRDLLDHFGGNVEKAIGDYNGGVRTPNQDYASGVKTIADYARRILEHASAQNQPNADAKTPDNPTSPAPCATAAANNTPATNDCVTPRAPEGSAGSPVNPSAQPKPPYRHDD